ncbi:hypothetical protein V8G54_026246 [Vigna mungo]|uniref:Uncharacterized protein n=1 Tax=Vigna mungo TaxID=3915 RepID=A0AAQ3MZY0_VIGMU
MSALEPIVNLADEGLNIPNVDFERRISGHQQNKSDSRVEVQSDEHIPIVYTSNVLEKIHNGSDLLHNNTFRSLSTMDLNNAIASPDTKATNSSSDMAAAAFGSAAKD